MNIAVLLYNEVSELEAFGFYSVLAAARARLDEGALELYTVARSRMSVQTLGGLVVTPQWAFMSAPAPDVLVIPGGITEAVKKDRAVTAYLAEHVPRVELSLALGTGALLLGELGLVRDLDAAALGDLSDRLRDFEVGAVHEAAVVKNDVSDSRQRWFAGRGTASLKAGLELTQTLFGEEVARGVRAQLDISP